MGGWWQACDRDAAVNKHDFSMQVEQSAKGDKIALNVVDGEGWDCLTVVEH